MQYNTGTKRTHRQCLMKQEEMNVDKEDYIDVP